MTVHSYKTVFFSGPNAVYLEPPAVGIQDKLKILHPFLYSARFQYDRQG